MRVLFLINWFPPDVAGGAEISLYHTALALLRRGVSGSLLSVTTRLAVDADEWYHVDYLPVHRVRLRTHWPWQELFDPRVYATVRRELRATQPDLVHIHNVSGASLAPFVACRHAGVPVVSTLHDLWLLCPNNMRYRADGTFCDPRQFPDGCGRCFRRYDYWAAIPRRRQFFQALTSNVRRFLSPSQALIERHVETGYARARFQLVPYGFPEPPIGEPSHLLVRKILQTAPAQPTVVFAGGGTEHKGAQVVLNALPLLRKRLPTLRVVVAGGGEQRYLEQFQALAPTVLTLGPVPFGDMRALFAAADLGLVASVWHENSPLVVYENFQCGTPVVGSATGGTPELIDEGQTGYLFPSGDAAALTEKIVQHFAKSPVERRRMRQRCVQTVRTRLGLAAHVEAHLAVYGEIVGS